MKEMETKITTENFLYVLQRIQYHEDAFHGVVHFRNVNENIRILLKELEHLQPKQEVCTVAGIWHDYGRLFVDMGHEERSALEFEKYAKLKDYDKSFISDVTVSIRTHNWKDEPTTIEGMILQDADKLDFYDLDRLKVATEDQRKEIFELYDYVIENTLNFKKAELWFKFKHEIAMETYNM